MIDTTLLIDVLQGNEKAKRYLTLNNNVTLGISRIVVMEIMAGSRSKDELVKNHKFIKYLNLEIVEIDEQISKLAGKIFETYFHQFGLGITDALIAATAIIKNKELVTHNTKHFRFIKELKLVKPY